MEPENHLSRTFPAVHDASKVIKAKVSARVNDSKLPKPVKGIVAGRAAKVASKLMKPPKIAEKMGKKICKKIPKKMKEKGLTVEMEEVFREGPYVVLQLQVQHVDTIAVEKAQREENVDLGQDDDAQSSSVAGALLDWSMWLIGQNNQKKLEGGFLPQKVQAKLQTKMMAMMADKFEEKQLKADVEIMKEEKQARFFYSRLKAVRLAAEEAQGTNPIKKLKKKMKKGDDDDSSDDDSDF
jgi:hypothetical protein